MKLVVYHATPKENIASIMANGFLPGMRHGSTLAGRKNQFLTKTKKGVVWDVRRLIPWAMSLDNASLLRVPRKVILSYEVGDDDDWVFSSGVSSGGPGTTFFQSVIPDDFNPVKAELLLTRVALSRVRVYEQGGALEKDKVKAVLPKVQPSPYTSEKGRLMALVESFFEGMEIGLHGKAVSCYRYDGERSLRFAKARNAGGWQVYCRPLEDNEPWFVLLDDLTIEGARRVYDDHSDMMVVNTSPGNYQVWLRFGVPLMISEKLKLIENYHGDKKAHPNRRWGRLPGFTNRKEKYNQGGNYPWVKLICLKSHGKDLRGFGEGY